MSLRLRLALCYGILFALLLPLVSFVSYAIHARSQYDDLDRVLVTTAGHAAAELSVTTSKPHLVQGKEGLEVALRLYRSDGTLLDLTRGTEAFPAVDPRTILRHPVGSALDTLAQLVPPLMTTPSISADGVFGLLTLPEQRWRVYVLPIHSDREENPAITTSYIEAATPLGRTDASMEALRLALPMIGLGSLLLALVGSWMVAGSALRPISHMIQTAQGITLSQDLSHRIEASSHHDELGCLALTFNEMLTSIENAHRMQQRFISDASHELRAPLTAIQGNLELLCRHRVMTETDREEALAEMQRETDRLARLVADLLSLARADAGIQLKRCPLDLGGVVLDAFRTARQLTRGHTFVLEPFEPVIVKGDEDRLKQLILILLDNALKYTPGEGSVTLGLRYDENMAELLVRDTGLGIAFEDLSHVFERFYRADPARSRDPGGTGLGLSIAQWIVTQHGGTISVASQPGQGTTMTVHIPRTLPVS